MDWTSNQWTKGSFTYLPLFQTLFPLHVYICTEITFVYISEMLLKLSFSDIYWRQIDHILLNQPNCHSFYFTKWLWKKRFDSLYKYSAEKFSRLLIGKELNMGELSELHFKGNQISVNNNKSCIGFHVSS